MNTVKSTNKYTEREMVLDFCKVLERENVVFAVEVPFMNRSVDLVFYKDEKIKAIEFKLHDWQKAVKQAKVHSLGADEVYVCLPHDSYAHRVEQMRPTFEENKCGLLLFDIEKKQIDVVLSFDICSNWRGGVAIMRKGVDYSIENQNYQLLTGNV